MFFFYLYLVQIGVFEFCLWIDASQPILIFIFIKSYSETTKKGILKEKKLTHNLLSVTWCNLLKISLLLSSSKVVTFEKMAQGSADTRLTSQTRQTFLGTHWSTTWKAVTRWNPSPTVREGLTKNIESLKTPHLELVSSVCGNFFYWISVLPNLDIFTEKTLDHKLCNANKNSKLWQ